jgi:hypothetical protein
MDKLKERLEKVLEHCIEKECFANHCGYYRKGQYIPNYDGCEDLLEIIQENYTGEDNEDILDEMETREYLVANLIRTKYSEHFHID